MASYRIVCTDQAPADKPPSHQHIVNVGTGTNPIRADKRWSLQQVLDAMDKGDTFYTIGERSGKRAEVDKYWCTPCGRWFIRSHADAVQDNNLDNLPRC
ncbi:MAG: DUF3892 domain-containing protein [Gemmataceae bacterium]|nr:DUF3892 domain-containing protein [Gemmataceae bacterium]MCI0738523.1 DUF3892 domain-containing protein [Gemmataceae bacterium]